MFSRIKIKIPNQSQKKNHKKMENTIGLMKESMKCNENLQKLMKKTKRKSEN